MDYQVYTPSEELQPFVKCYWTLDDPVNETLTKQRVVPDGCMEMIFHHGDLYRQYFDDGTSVLQPRSFIFGQITTYLEIAPTGTSGIIAARFLPEGLAPFLPVSVSALEDKAVDMRALFGDKGKTLEEGILKATNTKQRLQLIESFLLSLLEQPQTIDTITKACVEAIIGSQGQMDMTELAGQVNINRRNMERRFASVIGISPKQLSKVVRLQATLRMLEQKKFTNLTSLAYENGYYDQAHFIKDFKEFTGISPRLFYVENLKFAALFASE
jgi:AraC-like DNA-binding protein